MTINTDKLAELIAESLSLYDAPHVSWEKTEEYPSLREQYIGYAETIVPIIRGEARAAKVEALRDAATDLNIEAMEFPEFRAHVETGERIRRVNLMIRTMDWLRDQADEYEKGTNHG